MLELFQAYSGQAYAPFEHQARTFRLVENDEEAFLVAGTAAGKTLAIAVPLFHKLRTGRIRKVLLMYPTLALMEDQRCVMDKLAEITGLEVGQIQGGMSRAQLIAALNKPVILATPDAVYWFFRKNIKYNGLLIYGLAQVDEFVLDEAHLFNGLMLRNFEHLWQRIKRLATRLGRTPRLHILTATPTDDLKRLNNGKEVYGRSKCQDVAVEFRLGDRFERHQQIPDTVSKVLTEGRRKVLVVCNSARMAHQLFEQVKIKDTSQIPIEHRLKFGRVGLGDLLCWLKQAGIASDLMDELEQRFFREEDVTLEDVPASITLTLPLQDVLWRAGEILEGQAWRIKRALWEQQQRPDETWEALLRNSPLPCCILAGVRPQLKAALNLEAQQALVEAWIANVIEKLSEIPVKEVVCQSPDFAALGQAFADAGMGRALAELLVKRLKHKMVADPEQLPARDWSRRPVYLGWLEWLIKDTMQRETVRTAVRAGLESGQLTVECKHIGLWKGTGVPAIVYSGSMAKRARAGLIDVFASLEQAILISTSAVEVGVDFHADTLITEECEGSAFLQRFGRVGRHGTDSKAIVWVSGDKYGQLSDLDGTTLNREAFSGRISQVFPPRRYAAGSQFLDASHYLVNEQLGRIGSWLNTEAAPGVKTLAGQLRAAELRPGFGLRGTMPQITLRDGVTKDPFYLLRYVDDPDLRAADSPFEVARAQVWFTSLIYQKATFDVVVALEPTLQASQHLFILQPGQSVPRPFSEPSPVGLCRLNDLCKRIQWRKTQAMYFLLLHGDVYLARVEKGGQYPESVCDSHQDPLFIPDQTYLVLWGWTDETETRHLMESAGVADWEELYYDWDRLKRNAHDNAMVILERATGACFEAYKELVNYVSRQVQK
jgi:DEAD/DEAH box helicase domain-containing protein